jgi:acetolactate synthase-1/3 small subunit
MQYTLAILVEDEPWILTRMASLFSRRGYNIDSITVGPSEEKGISRIILVLPGTPKLIDQLIKQLYKLIHVLKIQDITNVPCVERQLALIKLRATKESRSKIMEIASIFRIKVVDINECALTLEITGDPGKMYALEKLLIPFEILEVAKTGKISLVRESKINTEFLKYGITNF